ncbi:MAG TPA: hypothetical protein VJB82_02300 [Candidatus Peribacterales bacterium]|nr:hypothetical protein [Candidatus Peribacterales bacterium]
MIASPIKSVEPNTSLEQMLLEQAEGTSLLESVQSRMAEYRNFTLGSFVDLVSSLHNRNCRRWHDKNLINYWECSRRSTNITCGHQNDEDMNDGRNARTVLTDAMLFARILGSPLQNESELLENLRVACNQKLPMIDTVVIAAYHGEKPAVPIDRDELNRDLDRWEEERSQPVEMVKQAVLRTLEELIHSAAQ